LAVLNIDRHLGKARNRVALVGVELEGAWKEMPPGVRLVGDGSVFRGNRPAGYNCGEIPTGPVMPIAVPKIVKLLYPQKVDNTCGMHVHMSFERARHYGLLTTRDYQDTIVEYLSRWGKKVELPADHALWDRLAGKNEFCKNEFHPELQIAKAGKDYEHHGRGNRYTIIHYCWRLKTIECRVLPMMKKADTAVKAIMEVIHITNAALYVLGNKKDETVSSSLMMPEDMHYNEDLVENI
jgi:hypothetical protein